MGIWGCTGCYEGRHLGRKMGTGRKNKWWTSARSLSHPITTLMSFHELAHASKIFILCDVFQLQSSSWRGQNKFRGENSMARHLKAVNATVRWEDVGQTSFVCVWDMHRVWLLVSIVTLFETRSRRKMNWNCQAWKTLGRMFYWNSESEVIRDTESS